MTKMHKNSRSKKNRRLIWNPSKYELYEDTVQDAENDAEILSDLYRLVRKKKARLLREDFCGTFAVAAQWVKKSSAHQAWALDIDPAPLAYGMSKHFAGLNSNQKSRLHVLKKSVINKTRPVDIVCACNFSYWIFKERSLMRRYFRKAASSLKRDGIFVLDFVGGSEMLKLHCDREVYGSGAKRYTYVWKQESFNPLTHESFFSISFNLSNGKKLSRAFTYDWRTWSMPELKDLLLESGFKRVDVYWEKEDRNENPTGEFYRTEKEEPLRCWIAFLVASKI
jgi:hypothetical protein